jgi:hypothetical protein
MNMKAKVLAVAVASISMAGSAQAIEFVFDYSYDDGFMTLERRAILEQAASVLETRITDELGAIGPDGTFRSRIFFSSPATGQSANEQSAVIGANQLRVYVGNRGLGEGVTHNSAGTVASPTGGDMSDAAYTAYRAAMMSRGQAGVLTSTQTDFGPWGGALAFNSAIAYYFDNDLSTTESFEGYDFYTAALRGLIGILGFGGGLVNNTAASYFAQADNANKLFNGVNAVAENGGVAVALDAESYRFLGESVASTVGGLSQTALMTKTLSAGERRQVTDLDWAVLSDIGWQVAAVPEPAEYAMFLAGLGVLTVVSRRRKGGRRD